MFLLAKTAPCSRAVAALAMGALLAACSESTETWQDGLGELEQGKAVFSFMLVGAPPEGSALRIGLHESGMEDPCLLYRPDAVLSEATPFWYLLVNVGRAEPGEYDIVTSMDLAPADSPDGGADGGAGDRNHAEVILRRIVGSGEKDVSMSAIGGKVTVAKAPRDVREWEDGTAAAITIEAEFPETLMTTLECNGGVGEGGKNFEGWCDCEDEDGHVTQCTLSSISEETCCYDPQGARVAFRKEVTASQCPWMCTWLMGYGELARYCQALLSGG